MSQQQLAQLANVSLATVQNIEANKANPSLGVLSNILQVLGLRIELVQAPINWDLLAELGVPITQEKRVDVKNMDKSQMLIAELKRTLGSTDLSQREKEVLEASVLAIKTHYPSLYKKQFKNISEIKNISGRHIKLSKLFLSKASEYL